MIKEFGFFIIFVILLSNLCVKLIFFFVFVCSERVKVWMCIELFIMFLIFFLEVSVLYIFLYVVWNLLFLILVFLESIFSWFDRCVKFLMVWLKGLVGKLILSFFIFRFMV